MEMIFTGVIATLHGIIAVQDFRQRAIWWFLPVLLLLGYGALTATIHDARMALSAAGINMLILLLQFVLISAWFSIKDRKVAKVIGSRLGWGDAVFLVALCPGFAPVNFLVVYVTCIVLVLIGFLLFRSRKEEAKTQVPLAGGIALILGVFHILNALWLNWDLMDEYLIYDLLNLG